MGPCRQGPMGCGQPVVRSARMWNPPSVAAGRAGGTVPIDPDALASSIAGLAELSAAGGGLERALEHVVDETHRMFAVDGAGLLLLDQGDVLRYVVASDEHGRPTVAADVATDPRWPSFGLLAGQHGIRAVLGVPVDLGDGPVGTLNVYASERHEWDDGEVEAIRAYARIVGSVLSSAIEAHLRDRVVEQLQYALDRRVVIEQAKGILMEREGLASEAAFERIRQHARSHRERVSDVARRIVEGTPLQPPAH